MPIDPRIPLLAERPRFMSPGDAVSLQALSAAQKRQSLAYESELQDFQEQQAVRKLLSQPGATEQETGMPTSAAISSLYSVAPKYAQAAAQARQQAYLRLDQLRQANVQEQVNLGLLSDKQVARFDKAHRQQTDAWLATYDAKIAAGASEQEAKRAAEEAYLTQVQTDVDSGLLAGVPSEGIEKVRGAKRDVYSMRAKKAALAPAEVQAERRADIAQQQADTSERRAVALENKPEPVTPVTIADPKDPEKAIVIDARTGKALGAAPPPKPVGEKALPISAAQKLLENQQNLNKARSALELIQSGAGKGATGVKGVLPDFVLQRTDPAGVEARAAIADLGSMVIHDRSGAAVTAAEFPRLKPFIPHVTDDQATIVKKLTRFLQVYQEVVEDAAEFYRDTGYKVPEIKSNAPTKTTPKATKQPITGPFSDPAKERRYQEWKQQQK